MNICVIGAGNSGCAHAFKLAEAGHNVSLLKTSHAVHDDNFEEVKKNSGIWAIDNTKGGIKSFQKISQITRDYKDALSEAEMILVLVQTGQHEVVANTIAPFIHDKIKVIVIIPGNLGSVYFRQAIKKNHLIFIEGESTPYDARIIELGLVNILFKNVRNAVSVYPFERKIEGLEYVKNIADTYGYFRKNTIDSALHNPNLIVHTVGTIMSANRIEFTKGEFWMYREAFTPSIWRLINQLDKEKNDVIERFGGDRISYLDACKFRNEADLEKDSLSVFNSYAQDGGPKGPATIYSRYLFEDVANGLVLLKSLASKVNINTPICNALITIASALVDENFEKIGRTIESLHLDHLSEEELISFFNK